MSDLVSDKAIAKLAYQAGFRGHDLVTAVAVALAESGGHSRVPGDVRLENSVWGPSIGLWQIRSKWAQRGTGGERDELANLHPRINARHAYRIYQESGHSFRPWTVYNLGMYRRFLPRARAAAAGVPASLHHPVANHHPTPKHHQAPAGQPRHSAHPGQGSGRGSADRIVLDLEELKRFGKLLGEGRDRVEQSASVVRSVAGRLAPVLARRTDLAMLFGELTGAYGLPQIVAHLDFEVGLVDRIRNLAELADQARGSTPAQRLEWFLNQIQWNDTLPQAAVLEALTGGGIVA